MVDIHSHILWGLDDGARTLEESVEMAKISAETGTTDIVATPHANSQYGFDPELSRQRVAELTEACGGRPRIHLGSDFHLTFSNIEKALEDPRPFTINHSRYLMVELPELIIPPDLLHIFERMRQVGIAPVITHPERNRAIWRDEKAFDIWLEAGCFAQITAQSLDGNFGKTAKEIAWRLLEEDKAHFVASDAHDTRFRPPRLDRAYSVVSKKLGQAAAELLFRDNPAKTLDGTAIEWKAPVRKAKNRLRFFR